MYRGEFSIVETNLSQLSGSFLLMTDSYILRANFKLVNDGEVSLALFAFCGHLLERYKVIVCFYDGAASCYCPLPEDCSVRPIPC